MSYLGTRLQVNHRDWSPDQVALAHKYLWPDFRDWQMGQFLAAIDPERDVDLNAYELRELLEQMGAWFCPACEGWYKRAVQRCKMASLFGYKLVCPDCRFAHGLRMRDGWTMRRKNVKGRNYVKRYHGDREGRDE